MLFMLRSARPKMLPLMMRDAATLLRCSIVYYATLAMPCHYYAAYAIFADDADIDICYYGATPLFFIIMMRRHYCYADDDITA